MTGVPFAAPQELCVPRNDDDYRCRGERRVNDEHDCCRPYRPRLTGRSTEQLLARPELEHRSLGSEGNERLAVAELESCVL